MPRSSSAISPLTNADGRGDALAAVAVAAVAQLDGLVLAGGRAARHGGPPVGPAGQHDVDLDGRVAAGIEDLAALHVHDLAHRVSHRSAWRRVPAWADGSPTHGQAGDRHRRQPRHRQGGGPGAGRRGLRRRHRLAGAGRARGDGAELEAATGRTVTPIVVDTGEDASVRALVADGPRRAWAASTSSSTAPPSRSGQTPPPKLADVTGVLFWDDMNVKVLGYLRCAQAVAPPMIEQGWGRIINISGLGARSTGAVIGSMRNVAVAAMTKNLADELGPYGINVTVVHPGLTRTEATPGVIERIAAGPGPVRRRGRGQPGPQLDPADRRRRRGRRRRDVPGLAAQRVDQRRRHRLRRRPAGADLLLENHSARGSTWDEIGGPPG